MLYRNYPYASPRGPPLIPMVSSSPLFKPRLPYTRAPIPYLLPVPSPRLPSWSISAIDASIPSYFPYSYPDQYIQPEYGVRPELTNSAVPMAMRPAVAQHHGDGFASKMAGCIPEHRASVKQHDSAKRLPQVPAHANVARQARHTRELTEPYLRSSFPYSQRPSTDAAFHTSIAVHIAPQQILPFTPQMPDALSKKQLLIARTTPQNLRPDEYASYTPPDRCSIQTDKADAPDTTKSVRTGFGQSKGRHQYNDASAFRMPQGSFLHVGQTITAPRDGQVKTYAAPDPTFASLAARHFGQKVSYQSLPVSGQHSFQPPDGPSHYGRECYAKKTGLIASPVICTPSSSPLHPPRARNAEGRLIHGQATSFAKKTLILAPAPNGPVHIQSNSNLTNSPGILSRPALPPAGGFTNARVGEKDWNKALYQAKEMEQYRTTESPALVEEIGGSTARFRKLSSGTILSNSSIHNRSFSFRYGLWDPSESQLSPPSIDPHYYSSSSIAPASDSIEEEGPNTPSSALLAIGIDRQKMKKLWASPSRIS